MIAKPQSPHEIYYSELKAMEAYKVYLDRNPLGTEGYLKWLEFEPQFKEVWNLIEDTL